MDIRRTILWMIFSFSLLLLWNNWQVYNGKQSLFGGASQNQAQQSSNGTNNTNSDGANGDISIPTAAANNEPPSAEAPQSEQAPAVVKTETETVKVSTDVFNLTFDTLGAQLIKAELPNYFAPGDRNQNMMLLDRSENHIYVAQTGIVGATAGQSFPTHLTQFTPVSVSKNGAETVVVFQAESGGIKLTKSFRIHEGSYAIQVEHQLENTSTETLNPSLYLQLTRDDSDPQETSTFYRTFTGPAIYSQEEKFQKVSFSDINKGKAKYAANTDNGWISMVQHYFAAAWVPTQGQNRTNEALHLSNNVYAVRSIQAVGALEAGETITTTASLWAGPQDQKAMSELAPGLELVVDYGWLTIIAKPLFKIMTWIHTLLGNWGWTIVVLTLLIKLVFYPLSAASYRSMAKMKQVTPRMQALREQYKDDRAKLNAAMMEMYRNEKINPLGGCLPMLVQIPVFIALYWVLLGSVEMRGAPWIGWIQDLSARDPWFILPAFMMATMFLQIKLNPTPPDPMQARVMMIMPLVFGGMMFFFPAGLVLYWCVNNAISIIQQRYIMHTIDKAAAAAAR